MLCFNVTAGEYEVESGTNGIGLGRNRIRVTVSRGDLGAKYECRASNDALETPMISWVELDVNGKQARQMYDYNNFEMAWILSHVAMLRTESREQLS